jgi:hypothetical protein
MWTLIRNGGVIPMSFILLFGFLALGSAFFFALRAEKKTLGFIKSMALATVFATLAASCADVGATLYGASKAMDPPGFDTQTMPGIKTTSDAERTRDAAHIVIQGFAESTSPGIVGFSLVGLTWMLVAVGRRRMDERADAR